MVEISNDHRNEIIKEIHRVTNLLASRDDKSLREIFERSRTEMQDSYRVMDEYGGKFFEAPRGAYDNIWITNITNDTKYYSVDALLWDESEKETDLTVQMSFEFDDNCIKSFIDDVRVM